MTEMINGMSPLAISHIEIKPFRRRGWHPMYYRLKFKRYGWRAQFMICEDNSWDYVDCTTVIMYDHRDYVLKRIDCKSNKEASALRNESRRKLESFLSRLATGTTCYMEPNE